MTARLVRLVDASSMWEWVASQPGFVAAQLTDPTSLTPLERWYYEARTLASQSPRTSSFSPASTDDLRIDCFDLCYAKNLSPLDKHARRAIYGRHTNRLALIDECFWFKTICNGQVRHVSCSRVGDETLVASDMRTDQGKGRDDISFHDFLLHIWDSGSSSTTKATQ